MLVMMMGRAPTSLRGVLSRWLLEPATGIYLGNPSARVRDELWEKAVKAAKETGWVLQVWSDRNPQGFTYRQVGDHTRRLADFEGLGLVTVSPAASHLKDFDTDDA